MQWPRESFRILSHLYPADICTFLVSSAKSDKIPRAAGIAAAAAGLFLPPHVRTTPLAVGGCICMHISKFEQHKHPPVPDVLPWLSVVAPLEQLSALKTAQNH